ncbi:hypothetical protein FRC08_007978 [Ceratobasidium sp. 394]|nr:hypothetical protein FRC08_007978 [Ceratobasidium sp. 394]
MPLLAKPTTKNSSHQSLQQPTLSRRTPSVTSTSQPPTDFNPRRSQRSRRPSVHKLESDEYQASSRGSSRPPSPLEPKPSSKSEKRAANKPGNRPGLIRQPHANVGATSHESSPEPLATPEPQLDNSGLAAQGSVQVISRAEAIRRTTEFLGTDTSHYPARTLKLVLEQIPDDLEDREATPMEIEGGSAPAILQSTGGVVLGGGHQPPATGTPDDIGPPQGPGAQSAGGANGPLTLVRAEPRNEDTATEDESGPEIIELRPEDSVSQRIPPISTSLHGPPTHPHPPPAATIPGPTHVNTAKRPADTRANHNTATNPSRSDSESDIEITHPSKRQRLVEPLQFSHPSRPSTHFSSRTAPSAASRTFVAPGPSTLPPSGSNPVPSPDIGAMLVRVARLVEQVGVGHHDANLNQLAQLLGVLQSRLGATASASQSKAQRPPSRLKPTDLLEDDAEVLEAEAALELGTHLRRRRKPTLADFPGLRHQIASLSMSEFLATASTRGAYETFGVLCGWVKECYERVWGRELPHLPLQKAPDPLKSIIVHRLSWFRGYLKTRVRPKVPSFASLIDPPRTPQDLQVNRANIKQLLPNSFHCRDPQTDTDPYENPALPLCIAVGFFSGPEAIGMAHHKMFSPLPLPAVAMILTTMQHCLKEWKTGRFVPIELKADRQLKMYDSHLQGLLAYARRAPKRLQDFQAEWFEFGRAYAGVTPEDDEPYQAITQADRIRPDTPEDDTDARAQGSAPTKGKGRAVR